MSAKTYSDSYRDWEQFYQSEFGIIIDLAQVTIPEKPEGEHYLLFIAEGLTHSQVFDQWKFKKYTLEKDLSKVSSIRSSVRTYAIWMPIGDTIVRDESTSKRWICNEYSKKVAITLLERMIYESKYFAETGKNSNGDVIEACYGSKYNRKSVRGRVTWVSFEPGYFSYMNVSMI
jgi:hypothetical protein